MDKKKFLFISHDGLSNDVAWQTVKEGHAVKFSIGNKEEADIGDGFFPKVDDWQAEVDWADVAVFDDVLGFGAKAQKLRAQGKLAVGGTAYSDRLEDDRTFGQEELKKHGVAIIPYQEFSDYDSAIAYIKQNPTRYVLKPIDCPIDVLRFLFVGMEEDGSDVIRILEAYRRVFGDKIKTFQLQKKITGVEAAVGAFFNGRKFIYPINVNFEHKKLFPQDLGPETGEMGTAMFWSAPNKLFNSTLLKMEPTLAAEKYVGYIDLNCIVNGYGIYPLEFTTRFGYPTISIQQESMAMPMAEFLYGLAAGQDIDFKVKNGFHIGVRVVVPPFPYRDKKLFESYSRGATIVFKGKNLDGVHIEDVKLVNDQWAVAGSTGTALIVCGSGMTMRQAQKQAYYRISNILIPNLYYRTDIGDRWAEDSDKLHNWGYLREN